MRIIYGLLIWISMLALPAWSWSLHGLITQPAFEQQLPTAPIKVESLASFLAATAPRLEQALAQEEAWARRQLKSYTALPPELAFKASGPDLRQGFVRAIRINPEARLALYQQLLPGQASTRPAADINAVSNFKDDPGFKGVGLVTLEPGEAVLPLEVLVTASDEPDLGLDLGLFRDNPSTWGQVYGFGRQPFGNAGLYYGSQAPFHMGFFHENPILSRLSTSLSQSYVEMRIHQCRTLASLAFASGHDYWGWRFAGWGLHYLADLCQPYHARALPGLRPGRMAWLELQALTGRSEPKRQAVQLASNRHLVLERLERCWLEQAYSNGEHAYGQFRALRAPGATANYTDTSPRSELTASSSAQADRVDALLTASMPPRLVTDPSFEFDASPEEARLLELIDQQGGASDLKQLETIVSDLLQTYARYGRGFIETLRCPASQAGPSLQTN